MRSDPADRRRAARAARLSRVWTILALAAACGLAAPARATTLLTLPDGDLRGLSTVIVEGWVERVEPFESSRGFPETQTTIRPVHVFKGELSGALVVRDRGGELSDGRWLKIHGRPDYVVGRRVLVFATPHPDGEYQTAEFTLGKFEVWRDEAGRRFLARDLVTRSREGVRYLSASLEPAEDTLRDYATFVAMLRFPRRAQATPSRTPRVAGALSPEQEPGTRAIRPMWADWESNERYRWSNGATASWTLSSTANASAGGGYSEARAALAAWTNHAASSIHYSDGGLGGSGTNFIHLASLSVCGSTGAFCGSGVLGCGGPSGISSSHTWRGETYGTITRAHVEIRQTTGASCLSSATFAAAVTHELGHTLGFAHSDQGASTHDVCRGDENQAQMRSFVQSRGASLGTDDSDAARWVYGDGGNSCTAAPPGTPTPTRTPTLPPPTATRTRTPTPPPATATRTRTPTPPSVWTATPTRTPSEIVPTATPPLVWTATPTPFGPQPTSPPAPTRTPTPPVATRTPTRPPATSTPTPPPSSDDLRADFTWSPASPRPGDVVQFTDRSTGSPTRWSWTFGSGSLEEGASALKNPTWIFSREKAYTVTLTVNRVQDRSTRRRKIDVSASSALSPASVAETRTIPVAGHVTGADGRAFVTDVQIENPGASGVTATLTFQPSGGGDAPPPVRLDLAPRETRDFRDAVLDRFGVSNALGALKLEWSGGSRSAGDGLRMTSRTYTAAAAGTLGQASGGARRPDDGWSPRFVTGLARTDLLRSNVGAVNDSTGFQNFQIVLRNRRGETLGTSPTIGLAPGRQIQHAVSELFPTASGKGLTAEVRGVGGSTAPFAYGVVVDNRSGDSTFYSAGPAAPALYLPGVARVTGFDGAIFTSELAVANTAAAPVEVRLTFLERDRDNTRSPEARLVLAPYETLQVDDALDELFGRSETYGALAIESDSGRLAVSERIGTPSPAGPGSVGQQVDAIADHGFFSKGSLLGLRQDAEFRSNVGIFNPEPFPAHVALVLRRGDGTELGAATLAVPPRGYVQRSLPGLFPGVALPGGETLTLSIDSGDLDVYGFAAVIDNASQDPTFSPGLR